MTIHFYRCCVCDNSFEADEVGPNKYLLSDDYRKNIDSNNIHCPDCGSWDVEYVDGDSAID